MKMNKTNPFMMFLEWLIFPPMFYKDKRREGMSKGKCLALTMLSPMSFVMFIAILLAIIVGLIMIYLSFDWPVRYKKVSYKTEAEICAVTGLSDLPKFKHEKSVFQGLDNCIKSTYSFEDSLTTAQKALLTAKCSEKDSPYWSSTYYNDWFFSRGWNVKTNGELARPKGVLEEADQVEVHFTTKGFTVIHYLADVDFIDTKKIKEVKLPAHEVVNQEHYNLMKDFNHCITIKFEETPPPSLYKGWRYDKANDCYTYITSKEYQQGMEFSIGKGSKLMMIFY